MTAVRCTACGHVGEPDQQAETVHAEAWGVSLPTRFVYDACENCGSESVEDAPACAHCHELVELLADDEICRDCWIALNGEEPPEVGAC